MTLPDLQTLSSGGRTLAWREAGNGTALILIHGIGGSSAAWEQQFADFSRRYHVIAWDAPGYGGSDPHPNDTPTAAEYAADLGRLMDAKGILYAHLVGHSIGSPIAAQLATKKRDTVLSLTLMHPHSGFGALPDDKRADLRQGRLDDLGDGDMAKFAEARAPVILGSAAPDAAIARSRAVMSKIPVTGYQKMVEVMAEANLAPLLPNIKVPAMVIAGDEDPVVPIDAARAVADALPEAEFVLADGGVGHFLSLEQPERFRGLLETFLKKHGADDIHATY